MKQVWVKTRYQDDVGIHEVGEVVEFDDDTQEQQGVIESLVGSGIISLEAVEPLVITPPDYVPPEDPAEPEVEILEISDDDEGHHSDEHVAADDK